MLVAARVAGQTVVQQVFLLALEGFLDCALDREQPPSHCGLHPSGGTWRFLRGYADAYGFHGIDF